VRDQDRSKGENREESLHRYGSSTSARVAIPLGAALVAAIVLPAILLQTRDSTILPIAAPAASDSRIVQTQTQPKPAPKHHAAAPHARHVRTGAGRASGRSTPAAGHRAAPHAKPHAQHAKAHHKHAKAHAKTKHRAPTHSHKHHAPKQHAKKHHGKGKS
jgi:hypothetical protein